LRYAFGCAGARGTAGSESRERETRMLDILFVALTIGFFVVSLLYVWACDKLK
jgi:hypothetical protein